MALARCTQFYGEWDLRSPPRTIKLDAGSRITRLCVIRFGENWRSLRRTPEVAGSLRDVGEWLEVEDIHFIAKALGITVMLLMGARAKENDYVFRCVDQGVVNPDGRQATITLLLYEDHYYPVFSTVDPPTNPTLTLAGAAYINAFLEMGLWKFWQLWMVCYTEPRYQSREFTLTSWLEGFASAVARAPLF